MAWSESSLCLTAFFALTAAAVFDASLAAAQSAPASNSAAISQPSAASVQSDSLDAQIAAWSDAPTDVAADPSSAPPAAAGPRQIHGEAGAAVGSNGYRSGYVSAEIPVGADSTLGVGVSESQARYRGGQTLRNQSLDLSLMVGEPNAARPCSPGRGPDGALEPLWVSHLRDAPAAGSPACNAGGSN